MAMTKDELLHALRSVNCDALECPQCDHVINDVDGDRNQIIDALMRFIDDRDIEREINLLRGELPAPDTEGLRALSPWHGLPDSFSTSRKKRKMKAAHR